MGYPGLRGEGGILGLPGLDGLPGKKVRCYQGIEKGRK